MLLFIFGGHRRPLLFLSYSVSFYEFGVCVCVCVCGHRRPLLLVLSDSVLCYESVDCTAVNVISML